MLDDEAVVVHLEVMETQEDQVMRRTCLLPILLLEFLRGLWEARHGEGYNDGVGVPPAHRGVVAAGRLHPVPRLHQGRDQSRDLLRLTRG